VYKKKLPERSILIKKWVNGKTVLHLGCVQGSWKSAYRKEWIHGIIDKLSKKTVGIDILEEDVKKLNELGYDVRYGDAQQLDIGEKFDVIFAGELIEHLDNFKGFFNSCKKHMHDDSVLILTTPNSFGIRYFIRYFIKQDIVNKEHTCWFDINTMKQLVKRFDLRIIDIKFITLDVQYVRGVRRIILNLLETTFPKIAPRLFLVLKQ